MTGCFIIYLKQLDVDLESWARVLRPNESLADLSLAINHSQDQHLLTSRFDDFTQIVASFDEKAPEQLSSQSRQRKEPKCHTPVRRGSSASNYSMVAVDHLFRLNLVDVTQDRLLQLQLISSKDRSNSRVLADALMPLHRLIKASGSSIKVKLSDKFF